MGHKGVAWTKKIRIDFSIPGLLGKRKRNLFIGKVKLFLRVGENVFAFTSMIQIKIRDPENPQNPKRFLNRTTVFAILLHELAHTRHMHHGIRFARLLKQLYEYAVK